MSSCAEPNILFYRNIPHISWCCDSIILRRHRVHYWTYVISVTSVVDSWIWKIFVLVCCLVFKKYLQGQLFAIRCLESSGFINLCLASEFFLLNKEQCAYMDDVRSCDECNQKMHMVWRRLGEIVNKQSIVSLVISLTMKISCNEGKFQKLCVTIVATASFISVSWPAKKHLLSSGEEARYQLHDWDNHITVTFDCDLPLSCFGFVFPINLCGCYPVWGLSEIQPQIRARA